MNNCLSVCLVQRNSGKIFKNMIDLINKKIILLETFIVDDFPHGLDIYQNLFSYTSYGTYSVNIEPLEKYMSLL